MQGHWMRVALSVLVCMGTCAAQTGPVQRVADSPAPQAKTETVVNTNAITLTAPTLQSPQPDAFYTWPAVPAQNSDGEASVRVPVQYRVLPPSAPRGMRLIPPEAFNALGGMATAKVQSVGFYMDVGEVSVEYWNDVVLQGRASGYADLQMAVTNRGECKLSLHPVVGVSWYDCLKWCNARSEADGLVPVYYVDVSQRRVFRTGLVKDASLTVDASANGYRLPTSLEWEAACRAGRRGSFYPWGDAFLSGDKANYWASGDPFDNGTTPVGYYDGRQVIQRGGGIAHSMVNGYGLFDMAGNVAEWCLDQAKRLPVTTPAVPQGSAPAVRVVRGGSWRSRDEKLLLCGYAGNAPPSTRADNLGFRSVRAR